MEPTRIAVVGAGAFGRNHLRVYRELERAGSALRLVALVDADPGARAQAGSTYGIPAFASVEAMLDAGTNPGAASVCVPTSHHAAVGASLLRADIDTLIEKPFAASLAEADQLISLAAAHGRLIQVGHLERFNPAVTAIREHLNRPMFFEAHRLSVFTPRSLDVDVVLDLMIHDLDIVLSLVESEVEEVRAVGLPVLSRTVDIANVRLAFANGCIANFTASRVSTERVRKLRFFQPRQYLSLDFARQDLLMIDVTATAGLSDSELAALIDRHSKPDPSTLDTPTLDTPTLDTPLRASASKKIPVTPGEPLRLELEAFLHAVRTRTTPLVDAIAGRRALALALQISTAIADHARRTGLSA